MTELVSDAPDLEDLAAYLDDRLSAERRALVEERLARDEDYYDVFMETVRFQQEQSQEEDGDAQIVTPTRWRNWKTIAPLAVAATLLIVIGLQNLVPRSPLELLEALDANAIVKPSVVQWHILGWSARRGPTSSDPDQIYEEERCFRIGTRIADLKMALIAEDRDLAQKLTSELAYLTNNVLILSFFDDSYSDLNSKIEGDSIDSLKRTAAGLRDKIEEILPETHAKSFKLGIWNEVGRLAARAKNAKALRDIWRRRSSAPEIQERIEPHYEALEEALGSEGDIDFSAAEAAFQEIAKAFAGLG